MLWHKFKDALMPQTITLLLFAALYIILRFFDITCIIYKITGIPCPTCYMGRALISLLRLDFGAYAEYNVMAVPMVLAFVGELYIDLFGKHKKIVHFYCITVLIINMIFYLMRINVL